MNGSRQSKITAPQRRVLQHLPANGDFAAMPFADDLPTGTESIDGRRLFERHRSDKNLFRLTQLGIWLKGVRLED